MRRHFPALAEAASVVGSIQIRNRATLVGNVCNASPAADTVPVLAVYGAFVKVLGPGGERRLPVVDFIRGNRRTALAAGEFATAREHPVSKSAVRRHLRPNHAAARRRLGDRESLLRYRRRRRDDFRIRRRVAAPAACARRRRHARRSICSRRSKAIALDALISKASPITDVRASAEYRLAMLRVLAKRAQRRAAERLADGKKHG